MQPLETIDVPSKPEDAFYRHVLQTLNDTGRPYLVGGALALRCYTGIRRDTKDLDLFIRRADLEPMHQALADAGYRGELSYPHWLAKVFSDGDAFVDLIFNSGNGITAVDDEWFEHAPAGETLGMPVRLMPMEEMLWSKAFIMERERFDGADVAHLLHACAERIDWQRLLRRFGPHWRVLLAHLTLFGFIYPAERARIPEWLMDRLLERLARETATAPPPDPVCAGTLLSREQYLPDVQQGLIDARVLPRGGMSERDIAHWTEAIAKPGG